MTPGASRAAPALLEPRSLRRRISMRAPIALASLLLTTATALAADAPPPDEPAGLATIADPVDPAELDATIEKLVGFGTRHTLSEAKSNKRGIGAARRWVASRFEQFSKDCGGCLDIVTPSQSVTGKRIPEPVDVADVIAIQRGT